uniref:RNA helicase n=1 Tax=Spongospora subterranea TaxID=70186 RepID=A0A0H5R724_9EUKA|eukprot:CRZ09552.1 hypothetical protein [Spongospora subterranea]
MAYVPPHLRNAAASRQPAQSAAPSPRVPPAVSSRFERPPENSFRGGDRNGSFFSGNRITNRGRVDGRSTEPNATVEKELFSSVESSGLDHVQQGINFDKYDDIPVEVNGSDVPDGCNAFMELQLTPALMNNVRLAKYDRPTPVQKHAIPIALAGRDLMACAQTGSGKTAAFLLPTVNRILTLPSNPDSKASFGQRRSRSRALPKALILSPTRELTIQIFDEARRFCYCTGLRPVVVYGGADVREQLRELELGCDVLVATPGRLVDLIERGRVGLSQIHTLIFDEADRMLDMGFEPQIRHLVDGEDMPRRGDRQTLMFSATFPREIQALASDFLDNYIFLTVGRVGSTTDFITQRLEYAEDRHKKDSLLRILPDCDGLTLIFVETKRMADSLEDWLLCEGIRATSIHGDRSQKEREAALKEFKSGRCPVLVATDVAARGLDINNVKVVIQHDLPNTIDDYVHRIGRTGRCGNTGLAISFVNERSKGILRDLLHLMSESNQEIPPWFHELASCSGGMRSAFGGRGGGRGGKSGARFGSRDIRAGNYTSTSGVGDLRAPMPASHGSSVASRRSGSAW